MTDQVARRVRITGRVQGVTYRASTRDRARQLGVAGWVTNEPDGTVLAHVEGPQDAVQGLVEWMEHGPRAATVRDVDGDPVEVAGHVDFEIR